MDKTQFDHLSEEAGRADQRPAYPVDHGPRAFLLRVVGDSMTTQEEPTSYPDGCLICVDPDQRDNVVSADLVIAEVQGEAALTFKVFEQEGDCRMLRSLNQRYEVIDKDFSVVGKVLFAFHQA